ncbi:hypothetical protein T01_2366 [Trichinella spiralis]|uniref:Uncharacterized protein n=1 Tax=Trichinella spiralis TaxID=6334 RepID=A0A0V1BR05_TRISP|nr:hypothetical protein T01_2366 [Trichinella spiralis]
MYCMLEAMKSYSSGIRKFKKNGLHYCYQRVMSLPFVYLFVEVGVGTDMEHGMLNMTIRLHHQMEDPCGFAYHKGFRFVSTEFTVQCCLLHDLFASDSNEFGLFVSEISLEVPIAAQFGLRAVAYKQSVKQRD